MRIIGWTTGPGPDPVPEFNAGGEIERVYHEVRQSLQVTAVPLLFRIWAAFDNLLPALWDELRPNLETRVFEKAADQIRQEAVRAAWTLRLPDSTPLALGESRAWQVRSALALYHHINPKLLLIVSAVSQALHGERI